MKLGYWCAFFSCPTTLLQLIKRSLGMCDPHYGYDSKLCKGKAQISEYYVSSVKGWIVSIFSAIFDCLSKTSWKLWSGYSHIEWGNIKQVMNPQTCQLQVECALLAAGKNANLTWNRNYFVLPCFKEVFLIFGVIFSTYLLPPPFFLLKCKWNTEYISRGLGNCFHLKLYIALRLPRLWRNWL